MENQWEHHDSETLTYCHAGKDGECIAKNCPQKKDYKTICPLYEQDED